MERPLIVCLTPVKNEAWILDRFLQCASMWADHIIVADQGSDDGSREIARRFSKVTLIENHERNFNEPERQKLLIDAARQLPGQKLLIALDADEFLSADFSRSLDWELILRAVPGTVVNFQWACVLPDRKNCYIFPAEFPLGFMDDGSTHQGKAIHSPRLPVPENSPRIKPGLIKVLHLSTIDWGRFSSKVRWYQCWEYLNTLEQKPGLISLYRRYHKAFDVPQKHTFGVPSEWIDGYRSNILNVPTEPYYRWDNEVIKLFLKHGPSTFRRLAIWDVDWTALYQTIHHSEPPISLRDPRSVVERQMHSWLKKTQPYHSHFPLPQHWLLRYRDRCLGGLASRFGW